MKTAASHMPRVDGIGVSSAGVYVDNKIMIASLFLKVSDEDFEKHVKHMYTDVAEELGRELGCKIPVEVANDGDVTALAGAMSLEDTGVLGIAMGTSEAEISRAGSTSLLSFPWTSIRKQWLMSGPAITDAASSISRRTAL